MSDTDRLVLGVQTLVAIVLVVGGYLTAKLRWGWWHPRRPRR